MALFGGRTTQDMKNRLAIPKGRPLADFLPTITIKAKDFANEITNFNIKERGTGARAFGPVKNVRGGSRNGRSARIRGLEAGNRDRTGFTRLGFMIRFIKWPGFRVAQGVSAQSA
jgi:hypothetical protein